MCNRRGEGNPGGEAVCATSQTAAVEAHPVGVVRRANEGGADKLAASLPLCWQYRSCGRNTMPRQTLTPGALYKLLNDELRAKRRASCQCRMPLPYLIERPDDVSANWRIGTPAPCTNGCDAVIGEIAARLWPSYDLHDPISVPVKEKPQPNAAGAVPAPERSEG